MIQVPKSKKPMTIRSNEQEQKWHRNNTLSFLGVIVSVAILVYVMTNPAQVFLDLYSKSSQDDPVVKFVANQCNNTDPIDSIACINAYVRENFNYNTRDEVLTPRDLVEHGGDCKSWSVFYKSVFDQLEIKNKAVNTDNHVFVMAYNDSYICFVDQGSMRCY